MLNLAKGYKIYEPERLNEEYEVTDDVTLMANVDVEKIKEVFQHFIVMHDEPLFFILELPVTCDRENPVAPGILEETHKDVYYIDGCSQEECLVLLERYGELLINDGMNRFGFGCHESQDEIMLDKYNVVTIYSQQLSNYNEFFEAHGIEKVESLITASVNSVRKRLTYLLSRLFKDADSGMMRLRLFFAPRIKTVPFSGS